MTDQTVTRAEAHQRYRELVGQSFEDARGRTLYVDAVNPGSPDGREIMGRLRQAPRPGETETETRDRGRSLLPYATNLEIFQAIWVDQAPPAPRETMTHG